MRRAENERRDALRGELAACKARQEEILAEYQALKARGADAAELERNKLEHMAILERINDLRIELHNRITQGGLQHGEQDRDALAQ